MMHSAFGIDHGEFSKARRSKKQKVRLRPPNPTAVKIGQKIGAAPKAVANAPLNLTSIGRGTSRGVGAAGAGAARLLRASPALTGTAVVGGTGYGLYRLGDEHAKRKAKKKVV